MNKKFIIEAYAVDREEVVAALKLATGPNSGRDGVFAAVRVKNAVVKNRVPLEAIQPDIESAISQMPDTRNGRRSKGLLQRLLC